MYIYVYACFLPFVLTNCLANLSEIPADRNHIAGFLNIKPPACMLNWRQQHLLMQPERFSSLRQKCPSYALPLCRREGAKLPASMEDRILGMTLGPGHLC